MKILLATWGSLGDLNPFLALGKELQNRRHEVSLAGNPFWKSIVETAGIDFVPMGPYQSPEVLKAHPKIFSRHWLGLVSLHQLMKLGIAPMLEESFETLVKIAKNYDLLIAHHFLFSASMVAAKTGIPWATVTLAPGVIPSRYSLPANTGMLPFRGKIGEWINSAVWKVGGFTTRWLVDPAVNSLRKKHHLPPVREAIFTDISRQLNLQLYSELFAKRPVDWSSEKKMAGFCFWDSAENFVPSLELQKFLENGSRPWLFTLGSSAVNQPGNFFESALTAMKGISERAIFVAGDFKNRVAEIPSNVLIMDEAPYSWLMPRCSVVAHQCGIGTLAQVLRAGIPSVACPFAFDQPDNAMRLQMLGVAKILPFSKRTPKQLRNAMRAATTNPMTKQAAMMGEKIRHENGAIKACEILETTFASSSQSFKI